MSSSFLARARAYLVDPVLNVVALVAALIICALALIPPVAAALAAYAGITHGYGLGLAVLIGCAIAAPLELLRRNLEERIFPRPPSGPTTIKVEMPKPVVSSDATSGTELRVRAAHQTIDLPPRAAEYYFNADECGDISDAECDRHPGCEGCPATTPPEKKRSCEQVSWKECQKYIACQGCPVEPFITKPYAEA